MMATREVLNLREAADALGIEPWRVARLGRYLGIDLSEKRVPVVTVQRISREGQLEDRYCALRHYLLETLRERRNGDRP